MMRKIIVLLLSNVLLFSCVLVEEPSVEGERVNVIVPRDSLRSEIATQLFYWNEVSGAVDYELQLVSPSFDRIDRFLLDTLVQGDKFTFTLSPGVYQWRIRAVNFSSSTDFTTHYLFIDSTSDLSNQQLILQTPVDRDTSARATINFSWLPLYNAEDYEVELWSPTIGQNRVFNQTLSNAQVSYPLTSTGSFEWRVRARNSGSASAYETRAFFIDRSAPNTPLLSSPLEGANISNDTVSFSWSRPQTTGSSLSDTLYMAMDSSFSQQSTYYSKPTNFDLTTIPLGTYYWKVKTSDKAGNSSNFSVIRSFDVL